jgi:hypothetical protein
MDPTGSGGDAPNGWSLDDVKRYFTLQRFLPKNGGLFGSGYARFMADQENARTGTTSCLMPNTPTDAARTQQLSPADYAAIKARERAARDAAWGGVWPKPDFSGRPSTISIGGQTYREVDNGRANVLVPIDNPQVTPAELEERRRGLERVQFMAGNPLAAGSYGLASLFTASPQARDRALAAGAALDGATMAIAPWAAPARSVATPPQGQLSSPSLQRPSVRLSEVSANEQATGVGATITKPMLGTGAKASRRLTPPGWQGDGNLYNEARAHLLAKSLGGPGGLEKRNFVTLTNRGANSPQMSGFERDVAKRADAGEVVEFYAQPLYDDGVLPPSAVFLTALGSRGAPSARLIRNPAGQRK